MVFFMRFYTKMLNLTYLRYENAYRVLLRKFYFFLMRKTCCPLEFFPSSKYSVARIRAGHLA